MIRTSSRPEILSKQELNELLKKNEGVSLWSEDDIPEWLERANKIGEDTSFSLDFDDGKGTTVESKTVGRGTVEVRSMIRIPHTTPNLLDYDYGCKYDKMMDEFKVLYDVPEGNQCINYYLSKSPLKPVVSPRDFLYCSYRKKIDDNRYMILLKSISDVKQNEFLSKRKKKKKIVRGLINYTIYYIIRDPKTSNEGDDNTLIKYITNSDGRGKIPKKITNWIARKMAPKLILDIKKNVKNYIDYLEREK